MSPQWPQVPWEGAARSPLILNPFVNWAHSHSSGQRLCGEVAGTEIHTWPAPGPEGPSRTEEGS